ncbi:MAG: DUF4956 domain-containing protein [Butyricicoccus sp.]
MSSILLSLKRCFSGGEISSLYVLTVLGVTCLLSLYIFCLYRIMTRKSFYNRGFNVSLGAMSVVTAAVILTVQTSIVVSLGMVGALSIVRFRTAVKDPMDLVFLFWSISNGIICGAGMAKIAFIAAVAMTILLLVLSHIPASKAPMILVVNASDSAAEQEIVPVVQKYANYHTVKSRNLTEAGLDMVMELSVQQESELVQALGQLEAVHSVSLISHDGEVTL